MRFPNTHMDIASLRAMIGQSAFLGQEEREYWQTHLPSLTPAQCDELTDILQSRAAGERAFDQGLQKMLQVFTPVVDAAIARAPTFPS